MRFLITARSNPNRPHEPHQPPSQELFTRYMQFNEDLQRAGVLIASEGLNPNAQGGHVIAQNGKRVAIDGPFAESKELVGGFYLIEVPSLKDAMGWATRCPVGLGTDDVLEVRPLTALSDIPPELCALIESVAPSWSASLTKR